jgi:crotonobetainyl-CoA:carnitine CoA-transferase CaiB-like acyl-CoA transferase
VSSRRAPPGSQRRADATAAKQATAGSRAGGRTWACRGETERRSAAKGRRTPVLPLTDLTVLAVEQYGAGPWATLQLADMGAQIIKVEDPRSGGDVSRYVPPFQDGEHSLFFESWNRNKRSISLDLRSAAGRSTFTDLVRRVDAVFSNLRGDQPARLGLRYRDLSESNPLVVSCSLSGFGMTGPRATQGAYDFTIQGMAGWQSITGAPDDPPTKSGVSLVDLTAGYVAALAIIAGVWKARRDGVGCDVDLSLFEVALAQLGYIATWTMTGRYRPTRRAHSAHQTLIPFQNFATSDGWIVVACPKETLWRRLCQAIERPDWAQDERFATFADRSANRSTLESLLCDVFSGRTTDDWIEILERATVPCGRVNDVPSALADKQVQARDGTVEIAHPVLGAVGHVASPLRFSDSTAPVSRGPFRGEHTREVLRELCGYDDTRLQDLDRQGAFGDNGA